MSILTVLVLVLSEIVVLLLDERNVEAQVICLNLIAGARIKENSPIGKDTLIPLLLLLWLLVNSLFGGHTIHLLLLNTDANQAHIVPIIQAYIVRLGRLYADGQFQVAELCTSCG